MGPGAALVTTDVEMPAAGIEHGAEGTVSERPDIAERSEVGGSGGGCHTNPVAVVGPGIFGGGKWSREIFPSVTAVDRPRRNGRQHAIG